MAVLAVRIKFGTPFPIIEVCPLLHVDDHTNDIQRLRISRIHMAKGFYGQQLRKGNQLKEIRKWLVPPGYPHIIWSSPTAWNRYGLRPSRSKLAPQYLASAVNGMNNRGRVPGGRVATQGSVLRFQGASCRVKKWRSLRLGTRCQLFALGHRQVMNV